MIPFEIPPERRMPRSARLHRALVITWRALIALILFSAAGGIAYVLTQGMHERPRLGAGGRKPSSRLGD